MKQHIVLYLSIFLISCSEEKNERFTNPSDYDAFLITSINKTYDDAVEEINFWNNRIKQDTSGVGELGPLASAYTTLFISTGIASNLKNAEIVYKKAIELSANNKDSYIRALGKNLISQHRFKEAKNLLEESYRGISNKRATEMILFDVYMELGEYKKANECLAKVKNINDFNYLIRLSKWYDFKGDLDNAIKYLEKAKSIAESRNSISLKIWTYGNLGDYYGHDGRIKEAYMYYLQVLRLQPDNVHAKLRIAKIAYTIEENSIEAGRIIDSVLKTYRNPEVYLFKAELEEFEGNEINANRYKEQFIQSSGKSEMSSLYNTHLIRIYAETDPNKALDLATKEIQNRATPITYHYLAYAQLKNGLKVEALNTVETFVIGKTNEPLALYHSFLVYRANGMEADSNSLKQELKNSGFELGPLLLKELEQN